jgi:hypothetical protein
MKKIFLFTLIFLFTSFCLAHPTSSNSPYDDWRMFGHDTGFTKFTNSFAPQNISNTTVITRTFSGDADTSPIVIWDTLYYFPYSGDYNANYAYKLNASNISQMWANSTNQYAIRSAPSYYKGSLFVQLDNYLYQVNSSNLSQIIDYEYIADSTGWSQIPVIFNDFVWTGAGNYAPYVRQFNASNISKPSIDYYVYARPYDFIPVVGNYSYFYFSGTIYQASSSNISKVYGTVSCGDTNRGESPATGEGYYYRICETGTQDTFVQFNASNISQQIANISINGTNPSIGNGYVYVASGVILYQLNASNVSQQLATFNLTTSSGYASPAVTPEYVFVSGGSVMYQLNASNISQKIGSYATGGIIGSSPVVSKGFLYFGSTDDKLYQLGIYNPLPAIKISYPEDEKIYNSVTQINYSTMQNSTYSWDKCWYSNNSGITNYSVQNTGLNFDGIFTTEGLNNFTLFCNDSNNIIYSEYSTFYIDIDTPWFTSVTNRTINQTVALTHQINATDVGGINCFSVNNSNFSISCSGLLSNSTFLSYGNYSLNISVYDYANHYNYTSVIITVLDSVAPLLSVIFPTNNSNSSDTALDVNYSVLDAGSGVSTCWYSNDSMSINTTLVGCTNITSLIWSEGGHNVTIWANDSVGNLNKTTIRFTVDITPPVFNNLSVQKSIQGNSFSYQVNSSDARGVSCYTINDTAAFNVNCTGYIRNSSTVGEGIYTLNLSVNDSVGNVNWTIFTINVTSRPMISLSLISPSGNVNVTQNQTFEVSVNVSCLNADCEEINTSLYAKTASISEVDVAFVCYSSGCSDADDIIGYLTGQGFRVTKNPYNSWTDANLNSTAFDVIVVGGYTESGYYSFDSASDAPRDAYENEQIPLVVVTHYAYPSYFMGITNSYGSYDSSEDYIDNINTSHPIMGGFGANASIDTTSDYLGYLTTGQMTDPYSKLFVGQDSTDTYISGFALEAGQATLGTNPQRFVHLGFNTYDTYPLSTAGNTSSIIKQSICWAATGSPDCIYSQLMNTAMNSSPFYTSNQNPRNYTLVNNTHQVVNFTINTTGNNGTYEFFVQTNKTSYSPIGNITSSWNVTIFSEPMCIPIYQNTSWSEWQNQTSCRVNNTILQNKSLVQYDDVCNSSNTTFWIYQELVCDFCIPLLANTSWSDWTNLSCISNLINQSRQMTQYDSNVCQEIENQTFIEYRSELDCLINLNIYTPLNITYKNATQRVNISSDGVTIWYNWNGINSTYSSAQDILFNEGSNYLTAYANNSFSVVTSFTRVFTIDTISPRISVISPLNQVYNTTKILLNISSDAENIWYNWNGTNLTYFSEDYIYFSNETNILTVYANDSVGNINLTNVTFFSYSDDDFDGIRNEEDNLFGNSSNINSSGVSSLNVTINEDSSVNNANAEAVVTIYDSAIPLLNFTHNFSESFLDLSKIRIIKSDNYIIVNLSGQLQSEYNKTVYIEDNSFVSLCVKDADVSSINEISSDCNGVNETNMTSCLGGSYFANNLFCLDSGDIIRITNLKHSIISGKQANITLPIEKQIASGCLTNWTCSAWSSCNGVNETRTCTKIRSYCYADMKKKPVESRSCSADIGRSVSLEVVDSSAVKTNNYLIYGIVISGLLIFFIGLIILINFIKKKGWYYVKINFKNFRFLQIIKQLRWERTIF